jgi:anti-sigma factor RsiW
MTDCTNGEIRDLLPALLHGRLAAAEQRRVQAHVDGCEECRSELALLGALRSSMHHVPSVDTARVAAAIPAYRAPMRRSWGSWRAAAAAAVLLAAGGTSVALVQRGVGARVTTDSASTPSVIATADRSAASAPTSAAPSGTTARGAATSARGATRELALAGASIGELDDRQLGALLKDIEKFDAVPSADVDNATAASPLAPRGDE